MYKFFAKLYFKDKKTIYLPKCHSTNDIARKFLDGSAISHGDIIITDHQTNGRGNRGTTWLSAPEKNLTFSMILKPEVNISNLFIINMVVALALREVVETLTKKKTEVKWPNDIFLEDKKISGVLIESRIKNNLIHELTVGIGLNVNQSFPSNERSTSIINHLKEETPLKSVLASFKSCFETIYNTIPNSTEVIKRQYHKHLYRKNALSLVRWDNVLLWIVIDHVDDTGRLVLIHGKRTIKCDIKEVKFLY